MNIADLPPGYANIQLRRTDYVPPNILGNFHKLELALEALSERHFNNPNATYDLFRDGEIIAELPAKKKFPRLRVLKKKAA